MGGVIWLHTGGADRDTTVLDTATLLWSDTLGNELSRLVHARTSRAGRANLTL
jgi:hypothetical protein